MAVVASDMGYSPEAKRSAAVHKDTFTVFIENGGLAQNGIDQQVFSGEGHQV